MDKVTISSRLCLARDTESHWNSANPVLLKGEVAYSSDRRLLKVGDGTSRWRELEYASTTSMIGASAKADGVGGIVPTPPKEGFATTYLRADGTWSVPTDTTYNDATQSAHGLMSASDKTKLDGIAAGAQVNTVTSVAGKTGAVALAKGDVGLGNVDNTADSSKSVAYAADAGTVNSHTVNADVPSGAKFTDTTYSDATQSTHGLMSTTDKAKLDGIASGAEVNQNTFSTIKVGSTNVTADAKTDTLELAGSNVTITPDVTNDKVTIGITKTNVTDALGYTPPTTNTTYNNATTSTAGLMSADDKTKLNGIAAGAQVNAVTSVASKTGAVTLTKSDVGLGNVDNTADSAKSVAYAADAGTVNSHTVEADVPSNAKFTDTTYSDATTSTHGLMSTSDKSKLNGIASGAEVNQNTFSIVKVGTTEVAADSKTDTLTLEGSNVTITPDATNDKVTIGITKTNVTDALGYTPPTTNTTYSNATTSAAGLMSSDDKSKLNGIASGAEVNQNAFSNIKVGSTTVAADGKTDTLELAGSNVTITPDATNDKVTIGITKDNVTTALGYTPPTTNTTYSNATTSTAGLMSSGDKSKLNGIAAGAEVNVQSDWKATSGDALILNKPTLGTAAAKDVPSSGNASSTQVVMGNDSRLTNSRPASDVSSWAKASSKPSYTASEVGAIASSLKGAANGVAELDANGLVPSSQLPSYVDDVLEYPTKADFPSTGETGKIYVDASNNLTYRWSGTAYVEISKSLALGTTSSTAFRGDYGNSAYAHAVTNKGSAFSSGFYKITTNSEGHVTAATAVTKSDITRLGIPGQDTTYSDATTSTHGLMSTSDKSKLNGIASGAEVNQNAFSNIKVGSTTIAADGKTDTLEIAGSNVTITPDDTNDKVTIGITKANVTSALGYTPPTTNTTYSNATTSAAGLMSADDKTKLNGIAAGAQVNTVTSVAGKTGAVTLAKSDVGLGNVDNTADSAKSVAYAADAGTVNSHTVNADVPSGAKFTDNDTKNTAGSTDTSSKIFIIGATSQAANPQTYSQDTAYVGTDGKLYSGSKVVLTGGSNASSSVSISATTTDVYSMTSAGSVTNGTANVPTKIDTSKFHGGSFTRGAFSQGTLPSMTFAMDSTDPKQLNISFSQGTLPTHASDTFTAASLASGFYTAGTANTPTAVTLPGRSSAIKAWTGYSSATAAAQTFTGNS